MALEVDALVRSIENEKVEEEDREKVSLFRLLQVTLPVADERLRSSGS
jgi:hypothetical protein